MLRKSVQVFAVYFVFNPALSFNLYIHLKSGSFWFYLFTFVPNLSPFPILTVLLFKHFQSFTLSQSASPLTSTAATQIPWGSLNILLRSCRWESHLETILYLGPCLSSHSSKVFIDKEPWWAAHLLSAMFDCDSSHLPWATSLWHLQCLPRLHPALES